MAAVYKNGKIISTYSDDPQEAAEARKLAYDYTAPYNLPTYYEVQLICSNWLCNHGGVWVRNPEGLTENEAIEKALEISPVCSCGRAWKKVEIK